MEERIIKSHHYEISRESEKMGEQILYRNQALKWHYASQHQIPSEFRVNLVSNLDSVTSQTIYQALKGYFHMKTVYKSFPLLRLFLITCSTKIIEQNKKEKNIGYTTYRNWKQKR